jgi:putative glutamine amidotransferase
MKPVIGITTYSEQKPMKAYSTVSMNYVRSVIMARGLPILLPVCEDIGLAQDYIDCLDGLLLTGGEDVSPLVYGENPIKEVDYFSPVRDEFEIRLVKLALEKNIPVLGICRGLQVMNAALGGTLYQDIFSQVKDCLGHFPKPLPVDELYHSVQIEKNSRLHRVFGKDRIKVNSYHHQSVKDPAVDFQVTARSSDGIIEGIEHRDKAFAVAVQWHPEDLTQRHPQFIKLFDALVQASGHKV